MQLCDKTWKARVPDDETHPTFKRRSTGLYACPAPGSSYTELTHRLVILYSHYANHNKSKTPLVPHPGKSCAPIPRNLLATADYADYKKHVKWESNQSLSERR